MLQRIRPFLKLRHIFQAEVHTFQDIAVQLLSTLHELWQFYEDIRQSVCQNSPISLLYQPIYRLDPVETIVLVNRKVQNADDIYRTEIETTCS